MILRSEVAERGSPKRTRIGSSFAVSLGGVGCMAKSYLAQSHCGGAACTSVVGLHDAEGATRSDTRVEWAQLCCEQCPVKAECAAWWSQHSREFRPRGVVAGVWHPNKRLPD